MARSPALTAAARTYGWVPFFLGLFALGAAQADAALLTFVDSYADGVGGIDGLGGASAVTLSPDGRDVYVAGGGDSAVATFHRDPESGRLAFLLALFDGFAAQGIGGASAVVVSPDGRHVYVTGKRDSALAVFLRDANTGLLTFFEAHFDGVSGVDGLGGATAIAVSPEATDIYVAGETDASVTAFRRDASTGALDFLDSHINGTEGVEGLTSVRSVAVSPDGANLYAVGRADNAIVTFSRDPDSGRLAFVESLVHEVGVPGGLRRPNAVVASDDGRQVYVASFDDDIIVFDRDEITGRLTFAQKANLPGGPFSLVLDPSGDRLYVKSFRSTTMIELNVLSRNLDTGRVQFLPLETQTDGVGGASGNPGTFIAVSPDSRHLYATSDRDSTLTVFTTDTPCPDDCEPTPTATPEPSTPTDTPTSTPTPTVTTDPSSCPGDCNGDDLVTVSELILGINIAQETATLEQCPSFDRDGDGRVSIDELLLGVQSGLAGCAV